MPQEELKQELQLGQFSQRAILVPTSVDEENRTIVVEYTTGARISRYSWMTGSYEEELDITPGSVRLDRLNAGAPLLNSHNNYDLNDILGAVVPGTATETHATIQFSERPEVESIWNDVRKGIIRNISVGYMVHRYVDMTPDTEETPILRAVDWEPMEISLVAIPADAGAQVRSGEKTYPCIFETNRKYSTKGERKMPDEIKDTVSPEAGNKTVDPAPILEAEKTRSKAEGESEGVRKERERVIEIRGLVKTAGLEDSIAEEMIKAGDDVAKAQRKVLDTWSEKRGAEINSKISITKDASENVREGCEKALLHRFDSKKYSEVGNSEYRNMTLLEMCKDFAKRSGVTGVELLNKTELVQRGLHSTSDFPLILANVTGKTLRDAYAEQEATFAAWCRQATLPDLKNKTILSLSEGPAVEQVAEGAEYTYGTVTEGREQYRVYKYGKIIAITEEILINDDVDAFTRIPALLGASARRKESDIVYSILFDNANMADGTALFASGHANTTNALLTVDGYATARTLMRKQKGPAGLANLNLAPAFLIVGPDKESAAEKLVTPINATIVSDVNTVLRNAPKLIVESRLANGTNDNYYFLTASPSINDTIEYGYLAGQNTPQVTTQQGFEVDGFKIKVKHFFGAKAVDHRGMVRSTNDAS